MRQTARKASLTTGCDRDEGERVEQGPIEYNKGNKASGRCWGTRVIAES